MRRLGWVAALAATSALLAGCSGGSAGDAGSRTPTPSSSVSTVYSGQYVDEPAVELARSARRAGRLAYTATYAVRSATAGAPQRVEVAKTPTATRIVLVRPGRRAIYLANPTGQYACLAPTRGVPTCYRLARSGAHLPAALDPGLGHVFVDYSRTLARQTRDYHVSFSLIVGVRAPSMCYKVRGRSAGARSAVADGTYCYAPSGALTAAAFNSGRLMLTHLGPAPRAAELTPPASATPLPSP